MYRNWQDEFVIKFVLNIFAMQSTVTVTIWKGPSLRIKITTEGQPKFGQKYQGTMQFSFDFVTTHYCYYFPGTLPTNQSLNCWVQTELWPMRRSAAGTTKLLSVALALNLPPWKFLWVPTPEPSIHVWRPQIFGLFYPKIVTISNNSHKSIRVN